MAEDPAHRMEVLCRQLTETFMGNALCVQEIVATAHELLGRLASAHDNGSASGRAALPGERPFVDESTLSVTYRGRTVRLGHTRPYWLMARLTRSANRYVEHLDLLQEIWDDDSTDTAALRTTVKRLRMKLRRAGMGDLADAIVGHQGRYILDLT